VPFAELVIFGSVRTSRSDSCSTRFTRRCTFLCIDRQRKRWYAGAWKLAPVDGSRTSAASKEHPPPLASFLVPQ
jgi:hypothetical protein